LHGIRRKERICILNEEQGAIFGIDSKKHIKQWVTKDGLLKEFRSNLGVVVNPKDVTFFEDEYDKIIADLFDKFGTFREKKVYKSADIGACFPMQETRANNFRLAFARRILNLEDLSVSYCFTRINSKHLEDGKVTIFGNYGYATEKVDVKRFIYILENYYNILCGWKVMKNLSVSGSTFLFDGMDGIYPTRAWSQLTNKNNVRIIYSGDRTNPVLATADILVKTLEVFLQTEFAPLNESTIKKIVTYDGKVDDKNISYTYIGNPDLADIKPLENRQFSLQELHKFIKRPIIFVGKGSLPGQRDVLESLPIFPKIHDAAYGLNASIRVFDPKKDGQIIGRDEIADYFIPLTKEADEQYDLLKRGGANIEKLEIK
jgi:hypothetical protein